MTAHQPALTLTIKGTNAALSTSTRPLSVILSFGMTANVKKDRYMNDGLSVDVEDAPQPMFDGLVKEGITTSYSSKA